MNSLPSARTSGIVSGTTAKLINSVVHRQSNARRSTGSYSHVKNRETGFRASGLRRRPRMNSVMSTGTSVIESSDANAIADVFVKASGRNMRPSCDSNRKTGVNEMMMIASEKKIG